MENTTEQKSPDICGSAASAGSALGRREYVNECGVWICDFTGYEGNVRGRLFRTHHPTIPFEVFRLDDSGKVDGSRRVNSLDEAAAWLAT